VLFLIFSDPVVFAIFLHLTRFWRADRDSSDDADKHSFFSLKEIRQARRLENEPRTFYFDTAKVPF